MIPFQDGEPLQFGVGFGQREDRRVARRNGLDLGVGKFLAADVLGASQGVLAGDDLRNEPSLGFKGLRG